MRGRRSARVGRARLPIVKPIQGGRNGLLNALKSGRVDPLSARPDDEADPWRRHCGSDVRAIELRKHRKRKALAKRRAEEVPF